MPFILLISDLVSPLISVGALVISILVYLRQKSMDNENHLFQIKIRQYSIILGSASEMLEMLFFSLDSLKDEMEETDPEEDFIFETIEKINQKMSEFRTILFKEGSFIPKEISKEIDEFYNYLFDIQNPLDDNKLDSSKIDESINEIDKLEDKLDHIVNLMRKDLGVDEIDRRLKRRIR